MRRLCLECLSKTQERITAACTHNADKDADWWVKWWDKEIERQMQAMKTHCQDKPTD